MRVSSALLLPLLSMALHAAECEFTGPELFAEEYKDFILCGKELPRNITIQTSSESVAVPYIQRVARCDVDDRRPGFHVVLRAKEAGASTLTALNSETGEAACTTSVNALPSRNLQDPEWLNAMPMESARYIDINGIRTRYFERGTGPALILVHGGQAGGANNTAQKWEQNFDALSQHFRVIALDRLAQGGTDNLSNADQYAEYFLYDAQHLVDFILALDLESVSLVGHSQGGWPITWAAMARPDRVSCVVNIDTVMVPDNMALMTDALQFLIFTAMYIDPKTGPTVHSARRAMLTRYPTGRNVTQAKAERVVRNYNDPKIIAARNDMSKLRMNPQHPTFKALRDEAYADIAKGKFKARSLLVWGELDPQVPMGLGVEFNQMLIDAGVDTQFEIIEGAGHAPFIEFPEQFNGLVTEFCGQ